MGIIRWKIGIKQDVLLDKERRQYFGAGEGDIVSRRSYTWVSRVWLDGTGEDD